MSLSSCVRCWKYRNLSKDDRIKQAAIILGIDAKILTVFVGKFIPDDHPQSDYEIIDT